MNLDFILDERIDKDFLIQTFQEQAEVHAAAIQIALTNKQPHAWRATWILTHCTKKDDDRIHPYIDDFIQNIPNKKDGHQREILKILAKMKLDDEQEGKLFDTCMNLWEDITKSSSVRHFAFKQIYKTYQKYPELSGELAFICQEQYLETLSPGIKKIIDRIIKTGK
ncbi:hypothetical protein FHR24_001131 [Wenyingzhuangia heitensis]|uniref:HEAT repeat domain-containing protein n=1 Tax=Wenyingzhuangia heitensis TaxID=1487859 RepID=A0ABX0U756_9FLAO|nr:hypothetical protein [Wenyingzhuangia heitensis]NIJ44692.1 hypothetical protein [Wenyingzhuangia heitensis]